MPAAITPPSINSKDIAASQPIAREKIEAASGEEPEADCNKYEIAHVPISKPTMRGKIVWYSKFLVDQSEQRLTTDSIDGESHLFV